MKKKTATFIAISLDPFLTNVPLTGKTGSWKHPWKSDILSKDAGYRLTSLLKMSLFHRRFSNVLRVKTN